MAEELNTQRRDIGDLIAAMRQHKPGAPIPVYHGICGRRTTYLPCRCAVCTGDHA